jgi:hypothetical protein
MTEQRAMGGSPVTRSAQDYVTNSLQGGFLGSNPYLDQTFNRAALQTQNQLASEFGRAGRSVDASEGLRSQQLNDLAGNIYGGAYDAERNRMQGVLGSAIPLANQDYVDASQLGGVGASIEGLAGQYANAPGANLDDYLRRIGMQQFGQQTTQSGGGNRAAGALGGALTGASLASALTLSNPWTAAYAIGGGLLGGLG